MPFDLLSLVEKDEALIFLHKVRPGARYVKDKHVVCHSHSSEAQSILDKAALYAVSVDCS